MGRPGRTVQREHAIVIGASIAGLCAARVLSDHFDQFLGAAESDPVLAEWFLRRFSLLDSLYMVPSAAMIGRTVRHNMSLWWAQRRATAPAPYPDPARDK